LFLKFNFFSLLLVILLYLSGKIVLKVTKTKQNSKAFQVFLRYLLNMLYDKKLEYIKSKNEMEFVLKYLKKSILNRFQDCGWLHALLGWSNIIFQTMSLFWNRQCSPLIQLLARANIQNFKPMGMRQILGQTCYLHSL
jgi:hypothetical protein